MKRAALASAGVACGFTLPKLCSALAFSLGFSTISFLALARAANSRCTIAICRCMPDGSMGIDIVQSP